MLRPVATFIRAPVPAGARRSQCHGPADARHAWTAETPNLYTARFTLKGVEREPHDRDEAFRVSHVRGAARDGLYLNGVKIRMKGIDRHCLLAGDRPHAEPRAKLCTTCA